MRYQVHYHHWGEEERTAEFNTRGEAKAFLDAVSKQRHEGKTWIVWMTRRPTCR